MLTERQKAILKFEDEWPGGNRQEVTRRLFGVRFARYIQELHHALDDPAALEHDPMLVKRLNRIRYRRFVSRREGFSATRSATP